MFKVNNQHRPAGASLQRPLPPSTAPPARLPPAPGRECPKMGALTKPRVPYVSGSLHTWARPGREEHVGHRHSVKGPHVCFPPALGGQRCCEHMDGAEGRGVVGPSGSPGCIWGDMVSLRLCHLWEGDGPETGHRPPAAATLHHGRQHRAQMARAAQVRGYCGNRRHHKQSVIGHHKQSQQASLSGHSARHLVLGLHRLPAGPQAGDQNSAMACNTRT